MLKVVIATFLLVGLSSGATIFGDVGYETCPSAGKATVKRFAVTDCPDGSTTCEFVVGKTYTFDLEGTVHADHVVANKLPFKVVGTLLGIPFTLVEGDACDEMACPIQPGSDVSVSITTDIPDNLPALKNIPVFARFWGNEVGTNPEASACASIKISIVN